MGHNVDYGKGNISQRIAGRGMFAEALDLLGSPRIAVIGDMGLDHSVFVTRGQASRLRQTTRVTPGIDDIIYRVERIEGKYRDYKFAGGAASTARCLATFGAVPIAIGVIGHDPEAATFRSNLKELGIQDGVISDRNRPTTTKNRYYYRSIKGPESGYEEVFRQDLELDEPLSRNISHKIIEKITDLGEVDAVILIDFNRQMVSDEIVEAARQLADVNACPFIVDTIRLSPYDRIGIDILKCSWDQASLICNWPDEKRFHNVRHQWENHIDELLVQMAELFQRCHIFILTIGEYGSVIAQRDERLTTLLHVNHLEAMGGLKIGNPLGFADAYNAILAMGLVQARHSGVNWRDSIWRVAYVAGCITSLLRPNESYQMVNHYQAERAVIEIDDIYWPPLIGFNTSHELELPEEYAIESALQELGDTIVLGNATTELEDYVSFDQQSRSELESFLSALRAEKDNPSRKVPLCVLIKGPSRVGKTDIARGLPKFLQCELVAELDCPKDEGISQSMLNKLRSGGMVFLDELDKSTKKYQGKLLKDMEKKDLVNASFVAAVSGSDEDLDREINTDLLQRFDEYGGLVLKVRSLRDRRSDIPYIFLAIMKKHTDVLPSHITKMALEMLVRHCTAGEASEISRLATAVALKEGKPKVLSAAILSKCRPPLSKNVRFFPDDNTLLKIMI